MTAKTLLLNLPHNSKITRRYICSFESPNSLFPPYELLSAGAIFKERNFEVTLIDCIAEEIGLQNLVHKIEQNKPNFIISIISFESYESDINTLNILKTKFNNIHFSIMGHYPSLFPEQTLTISKADSILLGEPENGISNLINWFKKEVYSNHNLYFRENKSYQNNRIEDINSLPIPLHNLAQNKAYGEPLLPKPFTIIQTARGCPYQCNFCVKSYGGKLTEKSPDYIIKEIKYAVENNKIKTFRFIDDTFTLNKKRVMQICSLLIENKLNHIQWTCLSRIDSIDIEMAETMKKAGCKRIYFGVESGSTKILEYLNKKSDLERGKELLKSIQKTGIQTAGFFLVGVPNETMQDIELSVQFAKESNLNFIATGKFYPYPGTSYYENNKEEIEFNLFPYKLSFKKQDKNIEEKHKYIFLNFYLSKSFILKNIILLIKNPFEFLDLIINTIKYLIMKNPSPLNKLD